MPRHSDTNPHFIRPIQDQLPPQRSPHGPFVSLPQHQAGGRHSQPLDLSPGWPEPHPPEPLQPEPLQRVEQPIRPRAKRQGRHSKPLGRPLVSFHPHLQAQHPPDKDQEQQTQPLVPPAVPIATASHDHEQIQPNSRPHGSQGHHQRSQQRTDPTPPGLLIPRPQETNLFTWSAAIFCAVFWVVIIIGGLVVLIVYLVFRPRTPKFDISAATLNAAYLDMGYLLNADITVLANFTNPNKKVSIDFSYLSIDLYYGHTLIATQYVEPFSAQKSHSMFANVHMVVSQVSLGLLESQRLQRQIETDRAVFEVKGYFRARSNFGKILRYSYWLHGDCKVVFSRPPDGILVNRKCKTKH